MRIRMEEITGKAMGCQYCSEEERETSCILSSGIGLCSECHENFIEDQEETQKYQIGRIEFDKVTREKISFQILKPEITFNIFDAAATCRILQEGSKPLQALKNTYSVYIMTMI